MGFTKRSRFCHHVRAPALSVRVRNASSVPPLPKLSPRFTVRWWWIAVHLLTDVIFDGVLPHVSVVGDRMKTSATVGDVLRNALLAAGDADDCTTR